MKFKTIDELLDYTKSIKGKKFSDFDKENKLSEKVADKGILGKIIETGFYNYSNNNKAEADFANLGVELKVSGYIKNKNGTISAKERLVLGMINYNSIINEEFNFSKLIFKNKKILIIWYEYDKNKAYGDFVITDFQLYDMSGDSLIIKNDFEVIKKKVMDGNAHLLSEGDTSYLGACTKGANGNIKISQPYSNILAKPRAFSLKNSYLTGILRSANIVLNVDNIQYSNVVDYVFAQFERFIGETQSQIFYELAHKKITDIVPKNLNKMISDRVIGKDRELPEKNSLFRKVNYYIKNLPVDFHGYPLERMSFRNLRLSEFEEDWDNSEWKTYFEEVTIIVVCYRGDNNSKNGERILDGIKKISFNSDDIELFGRTYNMVRKAVLNKDSSLLPFPKCYVGQVLEVAPKGQKNDNAYETMFNSDITKICFMLDKDFLYKKLNENN